MAGIDCQAAKAAEGLQKELLTLLASPHARLISEAQRGKVVSLLGSIGDYRSLSPEERQKRRALAADLLAFFRENRDRFISFDSPREIAFVLQCVENLRGFLEIMDTLAANRDRVATVRDNNPRDQRMGENLNWLARERYPDRKLIVWAASFHNARNAPTICRELTSKRSYSVSLGTTVCLRSCFRSAVQWFGTLTMKRIMQ